MLKQNIIAFLLLCLLLPNLSAQSKEEMEDLYNLPPAEDGDLLCRCISTFLPTKEDNFYFKIDDTYHEVALVGEGISMTFPVRDTSAFTLYSKILSEEGKLIYVPIVQQALEGSGNNFIIILSRPQNSSDIQSDSYNINAEKFPVNNLYLFNQTNLRLGVRVDETNAIVDPYDSHTHEFQDVSRDTYTSAKIAIAYKGEAKIMASKRLRLVPGRRVMMFCFPSKTRAEMGATPLRVITLQDMPKGNS